MKVLFLSNAHPESGVGHHADELHHALNGLTSDDNLQMTYARLDGISRSLVLNDRLIGKLTAWPGPLGLKTMTWLRLARRLQAAVRDIPHDVWHATNQTLSFMIPRHSPSVVTVHDLIELLEPQQGISKIAAQYLYDGIRRASHLIAVSEYTAQAVQKYYGTSSDKITVIHNGVSPAFHPIDNFTHSVGYQTLRKELDLADHHPIILYVGSEHPRKNIAVALQAFAQLRHTYPNTLLIKVGEPGIASGRVELLETIDRLHLQNSLRLIRYASTERLNELYNLATVLIFPSNFEGFGLPPLQAMAAGTPVVCSNVTSLPEVVGDAALMHDPDSIEGFAYDLQRITDGAALRDKLRQAGLTRAKQFSWQKAAQRTLDVYKQVA